MYLKSLTVRGFKSFASATTFEFFPGVTAVVGPNGSGKSNVVDALAWVMGEQGAKTLRGGKMEDVIFAGTSERAPLGRAQVSLTIDNSDGALPIEYSEVTISRTLFRSGGSEYAINGENCRLLDIQELLSDSGLGREMHVIVGQGQLDRVLHATPEDRRGFIEEAAGILKHRRRKEKTLRKLEAMQSNLTRLTDLTTEIRRQLSPLGKQAEIARRAQKVQIAVRDARARLLADELVTLRTALENDVADETALKGRKDEVEKLLAAQRTRQAELERLAAEATPKVSQTRNTWYQLSALKERFRALANVANERSRLLGRTDEEPTSSQDPDALDEQAAQLGAEYTQLETTIESLREALDEAINTRGAKEEEARAEEQRLTKMLRAAADRREGVARLAGLVGAARSKVEGAEAEVVRIQHSITEATERMENAQREFTALEGDIAGVEAGEAGLDDAYENAARAHEDIQNEVSALQDTLRELERSIATSTARRDALVLGLNRKDGAAALLNQDRSGILGPLSELMSAKKGYDQAIAAALGSFAEAIAATDIDSANSALADLAKNDGGQVEILLAHPIAAHPGKKEPGNTTQRALPKGAHRALALVSAQPEIQATLESVLGHVVVLDDEALIQEVLEAEPDAMLVTRAGTVFTRVSARGGSQSAPSSLQLHATIAETEADLKAAQADFERTTFALSGAQGREGQAREALEAALAKLNESDAQLAAVSEKLATLGATARGAQAELVRFEQQRATAEAKVGELQAALEEVTSRLAAAQEEPAEAEPSTELRDELAAAASAARQSELDARLALRSSEEQLKSLGNRIESLKRAAESERNARAQAQARAEERARQAAKARAVVAGVEHALRYLEVSLARAAAERDRAEEVRGRWEAELGQLRSGNEELVQELAQLTDSVHRDEIARTGQRMKIENLENRSIEELGLSSESLVAEFGPDQLVPFEEESSDKWAALRAPVDESGEPIAQGRPFDRDEQEKRLRRAERDLAALGKVNPLALEEFAALEERHQFLSTQLQDLKNSRKDLLEIIREVDERVIEVFSSAFADTAAQFERVFGRLFPGGEGRLVLTDPEDMLNTGIEVEAKPAGKKIKRLSLLSGGERSLTAVALLVAIFKARPSPFYVMDEVEAALDDTNLGRLITIFEELRESSQLIIITHQKRTMEVADALYGVTMRGDGVSTVISQKLGESA